MTNASGRYSLSGVWVAGDFRDNLIIDRYDPLFRKMRPKKVKDMQSSNSEDAVTWNVFRSLRQVDSMAWLPTLAAEAFPHITDQPAAPASVALWESIPPPPSLLLTGDEGHSEIDVVLESPDWVWFIEAKYRSDISTKTTVRSDRDQVLRNVDVGSYYAGVRPFYFSLLVQSSERSPMGAKAIEEYGDLSVPRQRLSGHRADGLANLRAITLVTWPVLGRALTSALANATRLDEKAFAERGLAWLEQKGLAR